MERRKVERHIRTEAVDNPLRHLFDLRLRVIFSGNQESRDFELDLIGLGRGARTDPDTP